ncbi:MAG: 23S rRNA (pseudouridine(1915)-N(3))-methyltransferase RlmH [Blastocatellia bacterium]
MVTGNWSLETTLKLHFVWIGKTKDRHCAALVTDYLSRIKRFAQCEVSELKELSSDDERRVIAAESLKLLSAVEKDDFVVLMDERGREMTSPELAEFVSARQQAGTKRLAFVIGGFAGVSAEIRQRANLQLSLSRLTLTHELARAVLSEQIYRAFTILAGLPYHKF